MVFPAKTLTWEQIEQLVAVEVEAMAGRPPEHKQRVSREDPVEGTVSSRVLYQQQLACKQLMQRLLQELPNMEMPVAQSCIPVPEVLFQVLVVEVPEVPVLPREQTPLTSGVLAEREFPDQSLAALLCMPVVVVVVTEMERVLSAVRGLVAKALELTQLVQEP
jgi:hypothetical protein